MKSLKWSYLVSFCLIVSPLMAAVPTQMDLDRATMQAAKKSIVNRAMAMDDATAAAFWPLYDQYQQAREANNDKMFALIQDYAKNYQTMNDSKATELLNKMVQLQDEKNKTRADFVKKFSAALPGRVVARFFQADNKLDAFMNANMANEIPLIPTENLQALKQNAPSVLGPGK
jgi:hypothetical protein